MTERVKTIYRRLCARDHRALRREAEFDNTAQFRRKDMPLELRVAARLKFLAQEEKADLIGDERFGFTRTIKSVPPVLDEDEWKEKEAKHYIFDGAHVSNISSDYEYTIRVGLAAREKEIAAQMKKAKTDKQKNVLQAMLDSVQAVYILADKYRKAAQEKGNAELARALSDVPRKGASDFYEALVFFRLLNFMLWLNDNRHNTVGRFDRYMYPYYKKDIESGKLTRDEALELVEELFVSLNMDSDLYPGVQQGDNGQSLVLGGCDAQGNSTYNDLSELCLDASLELNLIDPKINLRVSASTPLSIFEKGTLLTKQGLGFPQYSNDDVVIPALIEMGYAPEDAAEYVVAACWEFIIPKYGMDIPNIDALSFPKVVDTVLRRDLQAHRTFDDVKADVKKEIIAETDRITAQFVNMFVLPSPLQSLLMAGCVENMKDISEGCKYVNYGIHGVGLSTAVDSLAAVKKTVFTDKTVSPETLIRALDADYVGYEKERAALVDAPKMGNNDDFADDLAVYLLDCFAGALEGRKNERGGIYRAGTGSAMYYIWFSENMGATADGRHAGEPFAANYSPSLNVRPGDMLSVIQSFTKPDLKKTCNGGPLTIEIHDQLFRNYEGVVKTAQLIKEFVTLGGHQLQLNAINRDVLLDAQKNPEQYRNLIVRVWGWSGYFNELDKVYQEHIIKRVEFMS